jgi:hypothetical protein
MYLEDHEIENMTIYLVACMKAGFHNSADDLTIGYCFAGHMNEGKYNT